MKLTALLKWAFIILLVLALCGGGAAARGATHAAQGAGTCTLPPEPDLKLYYLPFFTEFTPPDWFDITQEATLHFPRIWHTGTRLADGKVLVVGGSRAAIDFLSEVELFDPVTGRTELVASLHTPRHQHTATLLRDGRVLVVGGYNSEDGWAPDAEVYDPDADAWAVVPLLAPHGVSHTATLLQDGRVWVTGGQNDATYFADTWLIGQSQPTGF